jgi:type IV pilus biogenesis protein CpaD/CtpE
MIKASLLLLPVLALGACASQIGYTDDEVANEQLGQSVRQNIAAQTVNPSGSSEAVVASGPRTAQAVKRYQTDTVEQPGGATSGGGTSATAASGN